MAFQPESAQPEFDDLKSTLSSSRIQTSNNALYQTILQLINRLSQLKTGLNQLITNNTISVRTLTLSIGVLQQDKVNGPSNDASTDNAIARWDGTNGKTLQDSSAVLNDDGTISNVTDPVLAQDVATKNYVDTTAAIKTETYLTSDNESATLPNSRQLIAGTNITFDDTVANQRTISASGGSSSGSGGEQLHGLMRLLGDGATTSFDLLDFAEYLEHVGVNGAFVDPATFSLSANRDKIDFDVAPGLGQVITLEYVTATI